VVAPPGLVTIRDTEPAARQADGTGLHLALVMAHELAHQWFGGIIDLCRPDDSWLIEPLTTDISRTALEEIPPGRSRRLPGLPGPGQQGRRGLVRRRGAGRRP